MFFNVNAPLITAYIDMYTMAAQTEAGINGKTGSEAVVSCQVENG